MGRKEERKVKGGENKEDKYGGITLEEEKN